ncbi:hypothetical protein ANCDUO_22494 [Ancylostoma duodenale]|uniref:Uncharacterized protein n=1 Tax=Ancylostoma duodenale TaxID=51022 RepID=A0A0C2FRC5_9BILA|nr:hypothetical protein ANCDUO_22494 [Ancylostoma duodenale]
MSVEGVLRAVRRHVSSYDDDWADRLQHCITSNVLVTAAGIVSYKMFADGPLECMPPSFFPKSWTTVTPGPMPIVRASAGRN